MSDPDEMILIMEDTEQLTTLRTEPSPVVAALAAVRSQRFLSMPDLVKAGFKGSTASMSGIGHFHGGLRNAGGLGNRAALGNAGGLGNRAALGNAGGLGNRAALGNAGGLGNRAALGNAGGLGNRAALGNAGGLGNRAALGNAGGLGNRAALGNAGGLGNRAALGNAGGLGNRAALGNAGGLGNDPAPLNGKAEFGRASGPVGAKATGRASTGAKATDTGPTGAKATDTGPTGARSTDTGPTGARSTDTVDASASTAGEIRDPQWKAWTGHGPELAQPSPHFENRHPNHPATGRDLTALLEHGAALLDPLQLSAAADAARLCGFFEAADFAGRVEEISRSLEYLQVVAAQAVERTRKEAQQTSPGSSAGAAPEWRTGWTEAATDARVTATDSVVDDGYRSTAEFLRARLRISIGEARRRLALAPDVLPQAGMAGQEIPARREVLAEALYSALVPSRSATIISTALDKVRQLTDDGTITRMEHALTATAIESDPDFVTKIAKRWVDSIDQDGPEPSEEVLRQLQGAFLRRRRRHGLHHVEIFATAEHTKPSPPP
ncbi:hypothetical protein NtRootA1_14590 [Arthrobacter sp. NtRootA1]|nr:hypothetical protein NtRootA1_14590 [Arthrobacter sp. NtRootA1]